MASHKPDKKAASSKYKINKTATQHPRAFVDGILTGTC